MSVYYKDLIIAEICGYQKIEMAGRPHVFSNYVKRGDETRLVINETTLEEMTRRWKDGVFSDDDWNLARIWRSNYEKIDFEAFRKNIQQQAPIKIKLEDLGVFFAESVARLDQFQLFKSFLTDFNINQFFQDKAIYRWEKEHPESFVNFAPYSFFCVKTLAIFQLAVSCSYIGPRSSDAVDVQYLYYLPFCNGFVSGDSLHRTLVPFLVFSFQDYINASDLKKDLKTLVVKSGSINIPDTGLPEETNVIRRLWKLYYENTSISDNVFDNVTKIEFIRHLTGRDYCPCQSGLLFTECHGLSQPDCA